MEAVAMLEYRLLVERAMRDALLGDGARPIVFPNSGTDHARVVLETMVNRARSSVDIFAATMHSDVFASAWVRDFLARCPEGNIRILVQNPGVFEDPNSALSGLSDLFADSRFCVRVLSDGSAGDHVTITDQRNVRLESSHKDRTAIVAFGSKRHGEDAVAFFDERWHGASDLTPPHIPDYSAAG